MSKEGTYSRRISSEEASKGYVFVLKDKLSFFPRVGKPFDIASNSSQKHISVETYRCQCRGPEMPHDHYFIRWDGLKRGDRVTIEKDEKAPEKYHLSIDR
jgi:hypothetical protein